MIIHCRVLVMLSVYPQQQQNNPNSTQYHPSIPSHCLYYSHNVMDIYVSTPHSNAIQFEDEVEIKRNATRIVPFAFNVVACGNFFTHKAFLQSLCHVLSPSETLLIFLLLPFSFLWGRAFC
jgi:hypothetical protein